MDYSTDMLAYQQSMDAEAAEASAERYWERQRAKGEREGFDRRDDVQKVIRGAIPVLAGAIRDWVQATSAKKGRPPVALAPLKELDAATVAYVALSKTFHTVAKGESLTATSKAIGLAVQVEVEAQMIQDADPKAAKRFQAMAEGDARETVLLRRHERLAADLDVSLGWTQRTQVVVGGTVLGLILVKLKGIFEREGGTDERGKVASVRITEEALTELASMTEAAAWLHPVLKPMAVPPRPWTHYDTGAYLDYRLSKTVPMVRTFNREHQKMVRAAIKSGEMDEVLEGLNAIQGTRFAIDKRILNLVEWVKAEGYRPATSFPLTDLPAMPAKTPAEEWAALTPEARSAQARRRKALKDIHEGAKVDSSVFSLDCSTAQGLSELPAFFLPHSMDFRSRVYAVPYFNPQRSDHIKAMFHFADAVPLGPDGGRWLMIHLANCGDFNKVSKDSFDARVRWVKDNEERILAVAADAFSTYEWWSQADSPFCFVQACYEYAAWAAWGYSENFPSTISIALDGSCSGLQHYSAMTRSAEEGYHVNLLPREKPGDIYRVTAERAQPTLEDLSQREDDTGKAAGLILANGFGRSEVKRNVMTYYYGSAAFGMRDQHMADLMRPLADKVALGELKEHPYAMMTERTNKDTGEVTMALDGGFTCARLLANTVYKTIVEVCPKADEAANWFQSVAATLAHESLPVVWRTPTGLPVVQQYNEYTSKEVTMWLYDRKVTVPTSTSKMDGEGNILARIQVLVREAPTKRIDKKKARSAISPNVVHSLDASHLIRTVVMASRQGISHFQLIHDSFATHAGNTGRFFRIIREAFVDMYENYCPFAELDRYARSVLSEEGIEKLPPIPQRGNLDLRQVLISDYAFA